MTQRKGTSRESDSCPVLATATTGRTVDDWRLSMVYEASGSMLLMSMAKCIDRKSDQSLRPNIDIQIERWPIERLIPPGYLPTMCGSSTILVNSLSRKLPSLPDSVALRSPIGVDSDRFLRRGGNMVRTSLKTALERMKAVSGCQRTGGSEICRRTKKMRSRLPSPISSPSSLIAKNGASSTNVIKTKERIPLQVPPSSAIF
jgi:hypothetical protein